MTHAVLKHCTTSSFGQVHKYEAGACEAADERLLEEVKARRMASEQVKVKPLVIATKKPTPSPPKASTKSSLIFELAKVPRGGIKEDQGSRSGRNVTFRLICILQS
jgi:hypothetical protein